MATEPVVGIRARNPKPHGSVIVAVFLQGFLGAISEAEEDEHAECLAGDWLPSGWLSDWPAGWNAE